MFSTDMRVLVLLLVLSWLSLPGPLMNVHPTGHSPEILFTDPLLIAVPACGHLHIQIINAEGSPVLYWARDQVNAGLVRPRVPVHTLPAGVYLIRVTCGTDTTYQKFVRRAAW